MVTEVDARGCLGIFLVIQEDARESDRVEGQLT